MIYSTGKDGLSHAALEIWIGLTYLDGKSALSIKILNVFALFPSDSLLVIYPTEMLACMNRYMYKVIHWGGKFVPRKMLWVGRQWNKLRCI